MKRIFAFLLILSFASCQKETGTLPAVDPRADTILKDLSYGNDARQNFDLHLPGDRTDATPVLVLLHGGGWNEGDKADLSFFARKFQHSGFVVANANYRLAVSGKNNFPLQLDDINAVIKSVESKSAEYVYSKNRFYLIGHSAGGHLALSYAYTRNSRGLIKAVAGMAAPTNLHSMAYFNPILYSELLTRFLGAPLSSATDALYKDASPYYQANNKSVPTILFQGELDFIVNKDQATSLISKLKQVGVADSLILYPLTGHDWWFNAEFLDNTVTEATKWFNKFP